GEVDGQLFLSMEYVGGRDLASVLRSIGRLPEEKALDIARQLCAGLAALHDRGVLHRDLKPANVMLDEEGRLRITDFGLAGVAEQIAGSDLRSGTPLYMAPEQLEGREVSARSDIYSLGLVLYEVFTGHKAYDAETIEQLRELQRSGTPASISSQVSEVDPAVERIVARCLEPDPERRPPSAMVVATALPGGDPLAAALAMGETPSAALVAAAGGKGGIHPALGLAFLAVALIGLAVAAGLGPRQSLVQHFDVSRSADALEERARQLVADLGYDGQPVDRFRAFGRDGNIMDWFARRDSSASRWHRLNGMRPTPLRFWYRQSPSYLLPGDESSNVTFDDPPPTVAGMVEVVTDVQGRLVSFEAVPPERLDGNEEARFAPEAVWDRLFAAADLDRGAFSPTGPGWVPAVFADERRAWSGSIAALGEEIPVTVEAGAAGGRPVYFRLQGPWSEDQRTVVARPSAQRGDVFILLLVIAVLATGITLAVRHHRRGRTDTRGAGRLAVV
ncbi:MAG: serine/threonine-protein kinase, partial [Synechococcaceae cyanobacterium]|nr:serine/threonine-protein kinase [Synechococcaceae cyanobacterium]